MYSMMRESMSILSSEQGEHLTNDYVMRIPLSEGKYSVVAYGGDFTAFSTGELSGQGNTLSGTLRKGLTDLNDFRTELKNTGGEGIIFIRHSFRTTFMPDL